MLASVYSYRVMVKSVSSCCVRGRWVLSDPVTYTNGDIPSTRSRGQNSNTLTITRAILPDEGMYYCIATNDGGSTSSRSASLTVDGE